MKLLIFTKFAPVKSSGNHIYLFFMKGSCRRFIVSSLTIVIIASLKLFGNSSRIFRLLPKDGEQIVLGEVCDIPVGLRPDNLIWDLSKVEVCNIAFDEVKVFGDSLISFWLEKTRIYPMGIRRDYKVFNNRVVRLTTEDRFLRLNDSLPVIVYDALLSVGDSLIQEIDRCGRMHQQIDVKCQGQIKIVNIGRGTMILPEGDTIQNVQLTCRRQLSNIYWDVDSELDDLQQCPEFNYLKTELLEEYEWCLDGFGYPLAKMTCLTEKDGEEFIKKDRQLLVCMPSMQTSYLRANYVDNRVKSYQNGTFDSASIQKDEDILENIAEIRDTPERITILLESEQLSIKNILLTDILGRVLYNRNELDNPIVIEKSQLNKGDFILWIVANNKTYCKKIVNK